MVDKRARDASAVVQKQDRKFACTHPGCGKTFNRKDYLARHSANHLEVRPYQCPICPSQFARQDLLEKHMSTKSHEKRQKRESLQRNLMQLQQQQSTHSSPAQQQQHQSLIMQPPPLQLPLHQQSQSSYHLPQPILSPHSSQSQSRLSPLPPHHLPVSDSTMHPLGSTQDVASLTSLQTHLPEPSPIDQTQQLMLPASHGYPSDQIYNKPPSSSDTKQPYFPDPFPTKQQILKTEAGPNLNSTKLTGNVVTDQVSHQQLSSTTSLTDDLSQSKPKLESNLDSAKVPGSSSSSVPASQVHSAAEQYSLAYGSATELSQFSLDSFDLSLSDHYTWLFGSDFWAADPSDHALANAPNISAASSWANEQDRSQRSIDGLYEAANKGPFYLDMRSSYPPGQQSYPFRQQSIEPAERSSVTLEDALLDTQPSGAGHIGPVPFTSKHARTMPIVANDSNIRNSPPAGKSFLLSCSWFFFGFCFFLILFIADRQSPLPRSSADSLPWPKKHDKEISPTVHARMIEVLKPIAEITPDNPYFSLQAMKQYLNLYWVHFDALYPILHRPTFDPSVMEPALLIAIVTIGMAYSTDRDASSLAIVIHKKFRNIVFLMIEDQPQVQLWVHQTLLLTNYFDKMLGSTVQYDMSQFFHGTNIALIHFSGYLKGLQEPHIVDTADQIAADHQWREWVWYETTKRYEILFMCLSFESWLIFL